MCKLGALALGAVFLYGCTHHIYVSSEYAENDSQASIVELNKKYRPITNSEIYAKREIKLSRENLEDKIQMGDAEITEFPSPDESEETLETRASELGIMSYEQLLGSRLSPRDVAICCTRVLKHFGGAYDHDTYKEDFWQSGKVTWEIKGGDCDDGMLFAAALLNNRFRPYALIMSDGLFQNGRFASRLNSAHAVFIYKSKEGYFGSIGLNETDVTYPKFRTVREVVNEIGNKNNVVWGSYEVYDIDESDFDFINGKENNSFLGKK